MLRLRIRKRHLLASLITMLLGLCLAFLQSDTGSKSTLNYQLGWYKVAHFVDGDTIAVNMNGGSEKVRLIGIDTPETHKPNTPVQCYGPAAASYIKRLINTQKIRLVSDPMSTDRDRYDRLLRYVYLPSGLLVNQDLVRNGYAFYYPYFEFTKSEQFAADQKSAQNARLGLWSACKPTRTDRGGWLSNSIGT